MLRSQMAMWILTKFALIFFIVSLFAIIFVFEQNERAKVCDVQVQRIADGIIGRLAQILDSPVEDEQRSYIFEGGIQLAGPDRTRYWVNVTNRIPLSEPNKGKIVVEVVPAGVRGCMGSSVVNYVDKEVNLIGTRTDSRTIAGFKDEVLMLSPSDVQENKRSYYLISIKCGEKKFGGRKYLFIQDCLQLDSNACLSFNTDVVNTACGFS